MKYVIVRSDQAGVFAGYLESEIDTTVVLRKVRRLWSWEGANCISDLATLGTSKPNECRFSIIVDRIKIFGCCEIDDVTFEAQQNIEGVPIWKL